MKYSVEVLVYLQSVKNFFNTNNVAVIEFCANDIFYENIKRLSQWNYEKNNDPKLTVQQFEMIKCKSEIIEKFSLLDGIESKILLKFENFGYICLN